jgi:uncharacterized transporter YbjL
VAAVLVAAAALLGVLLGALLGVLLGALLGAVPVYVGHMPLTLGQIHGSVDYTQDLRMFVLF